MVHEQHGPTGAASGWPATGAWYCGKIVTGLQGGKLSTAKKIQFLQAPVASFVCELFSVFRQLRSEFWLVFFSLYSFHCLWNFYSVTCIHPLQYTGFNSPIHTFLCIIPSGGFTYCTYPHALGQLLRTIKWQYRRKIISKFQLAWATCLKLTKLLLATFHHYLSMHVSCS